MKNFAKLIKLTLIAITFIMMFSCSDDDIVTPVRNSISAITSKNPQFSTLIEALDKTGLTQTLDQNGPFTFFAPTNDAFDTFLLDNGFSSINDIPVNTLKEIILNHVANEKMLSTTFTTGYINSLAKGFASSTNNLSLYLDTGENGENTKINGISIIIRTDILASNGVIHEVDKIINLATIIDHIKANPTFSTLATAVTSTDSNGNGFGDQSAVSNALTENTIPLTIFAPTNDAFTTATTGSGFAVGATPSQVSTILQYHVTSLGNILSTSLTDEQVISMITDPSQDITIDLSEPSIPKITDQATTQANIIAPVNIQCSNGIIHTIDKVLQPNL